RRLRARSRARSAPTRRESPPRRCVRGSPPPATTRTSPTSTPPGAFGTVSASGPSPRARRPSGPPTRSSPASARSRRSSPRGEMPAPTPGHVLVAEKEIAARVAELGRAITRDYGETNLVLARGAHAPFLCAAYFL